MTTTTMMMSAMKMTKSSASNIASEDMSVDQLTPEQGVVATHILQLTGAKSGGGCRAFYSPKEWADRGEAYGLGSKLVVVHDGGDLAPWFNFDYGCYSLYNELTRGLRDLGLYAESCTCWYSAIYPSNESSKI